MRTPLMKQSNPRLRMCRLALLASTAILLSSLSSATLLANDECGPGPTVTCTSAGNPYASGIIYDPVADLTLIVESGAAIEPTLPGTDGIFIRSSGSVDLTLQQGASITTSSDFADGIGIASAQGDVRVYANGTIETGDASGEGQSASGIYVLGTQGDVQVVSSGEITTHGFLAYGITLIYNYADVSLTAQGTITTHGNGASAISIWAGYETGIAVTNAGAITTSGISAHGIYVYGAGWPTNPPGADLEIATTEGSSITVSGDDADGIHFLNTGSSIQNVRLDLAGTIDAQGFNGDGVYVRGPVGFVVDLTLQQGASITTSGVNSEGLYVLHALDTTIDISGTIQTYGSNSEGIYIQHTNGNVSLSLSGSASVATAGDASKAIDVRLTDGDVEIALGQQTRLETERDESAAIGVLRTGGDVRLYSHGTIETNGPLSYGFRIFETSGDVLVVSSGAITTDGAYANAMYLQYNYGSISVETATAITTQGDEASGIAVRAAYETGIAITHAGSITTSGYAAHGIEVYSADWATNPPGADVAIALTSGSSIVTSGYGAHGVYIYNSSNSAVLQNVTLDIAGTIDAQGTHADGIYIKNALGAVDIEISGSVSGGAGVGSAIRILGDSNVTLANSGFIEGAVITGDGDDQFTNRGLLLTGHADFGGGSDSFTNSGTFELAGVSGAIVNLESFINRGSIDLANGSVGDTLSISGDFTADGGALHLDAALDAGTADLLTLATVTASSNPTLVYVTDLGSGAPASGPILLIDAENDASNGAAFVGGPFGAYQYDLVYDSSAFTWSLGPVGIYPGTAEYPALVTGALLAFASDLSALHDRIAGLPQLDGDEPSIEPAAWTASSRKIRPWLQLMGSKQEIDSGPAFDLAQTKLHAGVDASLDGPGGALYSIGLFAGTGQSRQEFSGSSTETESDVFALGAHGSVHRGAFFADGLIRYEHQQAGLRSLATAQEKAPFAVDLLGLSAEIGYRLPHDRAYLQPRARLSYSHAWADDFDDASGATIDLKNAASLLGEVAARLGIDLAFEPGLADLYVDVALRREFLGETSAQASGLTFTHELPGAAARLATGVAMHLLDEKLTLFLDAAYAKGDDAEEISATGGLRLSY